MLKVAVLDDYQRVAKRFADWSKLESRCSVEIFDRHLGDIDEAIAALIDFDIICLLRERMAMPAALRTIARSICRRRKRRALWFPTRATLQPRTRPPS